MRLAGLTAFVAAALLTGTAIADVNVRTPWSDVYVGPGGVDVSGPWGGVNVPRSQRRRDCERWRDDVEDYYDDRDCDVDFTRDGCAIKEIECDD